MKLSEKTLRQIQVVPSREGLTSFDKAISANFSGEKKYNEAFRKNFKANPGLEVVLVLASKTSLQLDFLSKISNKSSRNYDPYHITRSVGKSTRFFVLAGKDVAP